MRCRVRVWEYEFPEQCFLVSDDGVLVADGRDSSGAGCSGMGTVAKVGLWSQRNVSCSLFQLDGHVWLQLDARRFCLSDGTFNARQVLAAPFVRRFSVSKEKSSNPEVDFLYWLVGFRDPWPDSGDFFEYVDRSSHDRQALAEFICFWQSRVESRGGVSEEEVAAVKDCVQKRLAAGL